MSSLGSGGSEGYEATDSFPGERSFSSSMSMDTPRDLSFFLAAWI